MSDFAIQQDYYARTAAGYDTVHGDESGFAIAILAGLIRTLGIGSVVDVGSGTGQALMNLKRDVPGLSVVGVEPSAELRAIGHAHGLSAAELVDGNALALPYPDASVDMVCEFAALHHIKDHAGAVAEMLRVARRGVFIADSNNFGHGSRLARTLKQAADAVGLWPLADWIKTRGKGYTLSEGDGLAYSYSVFSDLPRIRAACRQVFLFDLAGAGGRNLYHDSSAVAVLGLK